MPRILVVDDSAEDRYLVRLVLGSRGHQVIEAVSAPEALELIRADPPDLVVTDLLMPGMDGYEFVDTLRSDESLASPRVLFLSALYDEGELADLELAFAGCRFLAKPADPEQLLGAVDDALVAPPAPSPSTAGDGQSFDRLRVLTARLAQAVEQEAAKTAELDRRVRQQESVAALGVAALAAARVEDTFRLAAECVAAALEVELVGVFELLPDGGELLLRAGVGWDEEAVGLGTMPASESDSATSQLLHEHGVASGAEALIRGKDRPFGALAAYSTAPRAFDAHDVDFLQAMANVVGAAVERTRSDEELARLAAIVDSSNDAIVGSRFDGTVVSWNAAAERIYGYSAAEMLGRPLRTIVPPDEVEGVRRLHERVAHGQAVEHFRTVRRRKDGTLIDVDLTISPVRDTTGAVVAISAISRDVTEERRSAEERRRLAGLVEAASDFIGIATLGGDLVYLNAAGRALVGVADEEIGHTHIRHCFSSETVAEVERVGVPTAVRVGHWRGDACLRHFDTGAEIEVETTLFLLRDQEGTPSALAIVQRDVSEPRRLEAQLRQAQKMEAVGRLAGGLAHDFNNLLTIVTGYAELLLADEGGEPRPEVEQILHAARHGSLLTGKLLAFSRQQVLHPRVIDLNQVVSGIEEMLGRAIGAGIELAVALDPEIGRVRADAGQLEQVILNLAVNARDAMPDGGTIVMRTSTVELDEETEMGSGSLAPGRYVALAVEDTGVGIDAETQARMFEPFFTTKEAGKGTGLGLSIVYGIARQSGGALRVDSEPAEGTTISVFLPAVDAQPDPFEQPETAPASMGGTETVLVVEDDFVLRRLACTMLESAGYRVLVAADAAEATELCDAEPGDIHALVTDVVMPGMGGRELASRLLALRPGMCVLYMSGYSEQALPREVLEGERSGFLQKPFGTAVLLRAVRTLLDTAKLASACGSSGGSGRR